MPERPIIFLTSRDPQLSRNIGVHFPQYECVTYAQQLPMIVSNRPIWCFIDWILPDIAGQELCRQMRQTRYWQAANITMVLDDDDVGSRRHALRAGADDYMAGPLTGDMLVERLITYASTAQQQYSSAAIVNGELEIDPSAFLVRYRGKRLGLPPNEFRLLAHFVEHPDRVFSRSSLIDMVGKQSVGIDDRTVDVWIGRLRKALKHHGIPDSIRAVRSIGYVFDGAEFNA